MIGGGCGDQGSEAPPKKEHGVPKQFVERPLDTNSLNHLQAGFANKPAWSTSPVDSAIEYLQWQFGPSDRTAKTLLQITVATVNGDTVVTIVDDQLKDDSVYVLCDRLTMRRGGGAWLPARHEAAWQGRGRVGWTTNLTM